MLTPGRKRAIAETTFAAHATRLGFDVYRPVAEGGRYDFVLDVGPRLLRVQCKWGRRTRGVISVNLHTFRRSKTATCEPRTPRLRSTRSVSTAHRLTVATFCDDPAGRSARRSPARRSVEEQSACACKLGARL